MEIYDLAAGCLRAPEDDVDGARICTFSLLVTLTDSRHGLPFRIAIGDEMGFAVRGLTSMRAARNLELFGIGLPIEAML